jgi:RND superfamily putative drug exporter
MRNLLQFVLRHSRIVVALWVLAVAGAAVFALRLPTVIHGGTDAIRDSESGAVTAAIDEAFGHGAGFRFAALVTHRETAVGDPAFALAVNQVAAALRAMPQVKTVVHYWDTSAAELLGRDGRSALLLVTPTVESYFEVEELTAALREAVRGVAAERGFETAVTGAPAMFYDLTRHSSSDLLRAERIGIPVALAILLIVFRAPLAAVLPLVLALAAVTISSGALFGLSRWMPVSIFAHNVVTMIGLGIGVDYALLAVSRFRRELAQGCSVQGAVLNAALGTASAVVVSGIAVGIGFLALFLVHARFLHSMAVGGLIVVLAAVAASLTLLPVLLLWWGRAMNWPRAAAPNRIGRPSAHQVWSRLAGRVMARPWHYLMPAAAVVALLVAPAFWMQSRNVSAGDMPPDFESRRGLDTLQRNFEAGWMGPVVLLLHADAGPDLAQVPARRAVMAIASRLGKDARVAQIQGYPRWLSAQGLRGQLIDGEAALLPDPASAAAASISADGRTALIVVIPKLPPERPEMLDFVRELRADAWEEARAAGVAVKVGGASAMIVDFDAELFGSLWRIVPAVLGVTFVVLLVAFRSVLIPAKAVLTNLVSVLAAYGFLVLVFQHGVGAAPLRIDPPGGLNSMVVLMLFTILFGLSMDYEVFLLRQIEQEYRRSGDNRTAVASGLARSAGVITSAAAIMVCLFGSFAFTQLTATREFGLGLAFAVALDATLIRLILVPAMMELFGAANWWWPFGSRQQSKSGPPRRIGERIANELE